jgi:hypothetical protein
MTDDTQTTKPAQYKVALVEKTTAPEGTDGSTWHRYVLDNGTSTIVGQRQGTLQDVTSYAREYSEQLNERGALGRSAWNPRGRKPGQANKA